MHVLRRVQIGLCGLGLLVGVSGGALMGRVTTGWPHMLTLTVVLAVGAVAAAIVVHGVLRAITGLAQVQAGKAECSKAGVLPQAARVGS